MQIVFSQVLILFLFMLTGFALARLKVVRADQSKILSTLLVYVFLPCNLFKTFAANFTVAYISEKYPFMLASCAILLVIQTGAAFFSRFFSKNNYERRIYRYSLTIPNYGYMGYALAESLFGSVGQLNAMLFAIPLALYTYTYSISSLTKQPLSPRRLLNPVLLSILLGCAVGLSGLPLPDIAREILNKSSGCMAPVSMLLAGITISTFDLPALMKDKRAYIVTLMRLLIIPMLVGCVLRLFFPPELTAAGVLLYAMPCGLNTIVFPKLVDENCEIGAGLAIISNVLACLTIPICMAVFA